MGLGAGAARVGGIAWAALHECPEGWCLPWSAVRVTFEGCGHPRPKQGHPWGRLGPGESSLGWGKGVKGQGVAQGRMRSEEEQTEKALQTHPTALCAACRLTKGMGWAEDKAWHKPGELG